MPKYFYLNRPPAYAHQPAGFINRAGGLPSTEWETQHGTLYCFGWVEYAQPLPLAEIANWELMPDDPVEWAHYTFWNFGNRNVSDQEYYEEDYRLAYEEGMLRESEDLYQVAKILSEAKK